MTMSVRLLVLVTSAMACAVLPPAHADPRPPNPFDQEIVTTESRHVRCIVEPGKVLCGGRFANAPIGCGGLDVCPDGLKTPDDVVWVEAAGGELQWNTSNMPTVGYAAPIYDLVLTYGQVFHLKGWTVEPSSTGTRFTNDETGRGMFVSREGVTLIA